MIIEAGNYIMHTTSVIQGHEGDEIDIHINVRDLNGDLAVKMGMGIDDVLVKDLRDDCVISVV